MDPTQRNSGPSAGKTDNCSHVGNICLSTAAPRICVGQRYALTEAGYVVVRMAQEFRILESRGPRALGRVAGLDLVLSEWDQGFSHSGLTG